MRNELNLQPSEVVHSGVAPLHFLHYEPGNPPRRAQPPPQTHREKCTILLCSPTPHHPLPTLVCLLCGHAMTTASHNKRKGGLGRLPGSGSGSRIHAGVPLQPQIHPQLQPMCLPTGGGSHSMASSMSGRRDARVNPALAGADRGQTQPSMSG